MSYPPKDEEAAGLRVDQEDEAEHSEREEADLVRRYEDFSTVGELRDALTP